MVFFYSVFDIYKPDKETAPHSTAQYNNSITDLTAHKLDEETAQANTWPSAATNDMGK